MAISKRRKEVLAEYGIPEERYTVEQTKVLAKLLAVASEERAPSTKPPITLRELEKSAREARRKKDKENELAALRKADRNALPVHIKKSYNNTGHTAPHVLGQLSAGKAKRGTRDRPSIADGGGWMFFNGIDNGIEEKHHWLASPHDAMNTNLISQNPDTGTLTWHGDVCVHCGSPPKDIGEVMLAQYGPTEFICTDCGKHMTHHGTGMRGYTTGQIYYKKNKKLKPIPKWQMPIVHTYEEEEEDE